MWEALERGLDGMVGRTLFWLTRVPASIRPEVRVAGEIPPAEPLPVARPTAAKAKNRVKPEAAGARGRTGGANASRAGSPQQERRKRAPEVRPRAPAAAKPTLDDIVGAVEEPAVGAPEDALDAVVAGPATSAASVADGADVKEQQVLDALTAGEATMAELTERTGMASTTLRRRLQRLTAAGRVERFGAGMGPTRYRRLNT